MRDAAVDGKTGQLELLVRQVLETSKYRNVCVDFVRNTGKRELCKRRSLKEAVKATKNKLHQIAGAYFLIRPDYDAWLEELRRARMTGDEALFLETCRKVMGYHHSTRERLEDLEEFYASVFSSLSRVDSILDIACGFHPLAIPWMPLSRRVKYYAFDIYEDLASFLNGYMNLVNVEGCAETRDVVQNPPETKADLAFILNTMPCLEQIERSAGLRVLECTRADFLVVSFPTRSLGRRDKGMREYYGTMFNKLAQEKDWAVQCFEFESELVYVAQR